MHGGIRRPTLFMHAYLGRRLRYESIEEVPANQYELE